MTKTSDSVSCKKYFINFITRQSTSCKFVIIENPFAYFTQIIYYAFLRRIQREKRQLEIKNKILERSGFSEVFTDDNTLDGGNYSEYNSIKDDIHSKIRY